MQKHAKLPKPFKDLGVEIRFLKALANMGYEVPSEIQKQVIPIALEGKDILGQARTGTGKTASFGIPMLQHVDPAGHLQGLVLVPTRELASQVCAELRRIAEFTEIRCVPVYGGQKIQTQLHLLGKRAHVVVGTPGRVMDLMGRGALSFDEIKVAVLDEVDRMLDIGFRDDIQRILGAIKVQHQTIFVSATLEEEIKRLAARYSHDAVEVNVSRDQITVDDIEQFYVSVEGSDKYRALRQLLAQENPPLCIVFCNMKSTARKLGKRLHADGINCKEIHGDLVQQKREKVMARFRKHQLQVLIATDLAARGIDVSKISHIINFDVPVDTQVYVHRIGRTARMGEKGVAYTFVTPEEGRKLTEIEMLINRELTSASIEGFQSRKSRATQVTEEVTSEISIPFAPKSHTSDVASSGGVPARKPRQTIGSKFRSSRRRKR
jgi:ATP-dependent RNA helicase DeaD